MTYLLENRSGDLRVAIVFGYGAWGNVRRSIECVKCAGLLPLLLVNAECDEYTSLLPGSLILRSVWLNRNHDRLWQEVLERLAFLGIEGVDSIAAMVNFTDRCWACYLDLTARFGRCATLPRAAVLRSVNKANLRHATRGTSFEVPHMVWQMDKPNAEDAAFATIRSWCCKYVVVKPLFGQSGEAITKVQVDDSTFGESLRNAIAKVHALQCTIYGDDITCELLVSDTKVQVNRLALVEQYVRGSEYSVEGLVSDTGVIETVLVQIKSKQEEVPAFRDLEYAASRNGPDEDIIKGVSDLLNLVGLTCSAFHIELKRCEDGRIVPIEINARMGGGSIVDLFFAGCGVDLQGRAIAMQLAKHRAPCVRLTTVIQPEVGTVGTIVAYTGLDEVAREADVVFVKRLAPVGSVVGPIDREMYLVEFCVVGASLADAQARAAQLKERIRIVIA